METVMQMNVQMRPGCVTSFCVQWACREGNWEGRRSTLWKHLTQRGGHMDSGGKGAAGHFVCMSLGVLNKEMKRMLSSGLYPVWTRRLMLSIFQRKEIQSARGEANFVIGAIQISSLLFYLAHNNPQKTWIPHILFSCNKGSGGDLHIV